jgi:hypothetical protein
MTRTSCSACGSPDLEMFLDLGTSPIADAYTATPDEVSPRYPLQVAVCGKCRLVQLLEVVPADVLFGTGYSFYSSASAPLSAYHEAYAEQVLDRYGEQAKRGVVEIGCNDGDLLQHFKHLRHLGVDPSVGPAEVARQRGCTVVGSPFGLLKALSLHDPTAPPGVVIANHVLAHVEDVSDCLAGIAALMDGKSIAMIEVQYLPDLLVNNAFDLVYHEHRNFFSLTSLEAAASRHGLFVVDAELTERQGGSLRATLALTGGAPARTSRAGAILASEQWLNDFSAYAGMQGRAERIRTRLQDLIASVVDESQVALYGAPAKATTLTSYCGLTSAQLHWCVDTTAAKQGRYIPGTDIHILAPEDAPPADVYVLGAHNYARSIMAANPFKEWILPFPSPVLL